MQVNVQDDTTGLDAGYEKSFAIGRPIHALQVIPALHCDVLKCLRLQVQQKNVTCRHLLNGDSRRIRRQGPLEVTPGRQFKPPKLSSLFAPWTKASEYEF